MTGYSDSFTFFPIYFMEVCSLVLVLLPADRQGAFLHLFGAKAATGRNLSYKRGFME
jgi:hypothetical protein